MLFAAAENAAREVEVGSLQAKPGPPELKTGRGGRIRTADILLPKQARYRTALHPDFLFAACLES